MVKTALTQLIVLLVTGIAAAAETAVPGSTGGGMAAATFYGYSLIAAGIGVGIAACGGGIGMGLVFSATQQGIARQPELSSKLNGMMYLQFALIEAQVLYALFLALFFIFVNPFASKIAG